MSCNSWKEIEEPKCKVGFYVSKCIKSEMNKYCIVIGSGGPTSKAMKWWMDVCIKTAPLEFVFTERIGKLVINK